VCQPARAGLGAARVHRRAASRGAACVRASLGFVRTRARALALQPPEPACGPCPPPGRSVHANTPAGSTHPSLLGPLCLETLTAAPPPPTLRSSHAIASAPPHTHTLQEAIEKLKEDGGGEGGADDEAAKKQKKKDKVRGRGGCAGGAARCLALRSWAC